MSDEGKKKGNLRPIGSPPVGAGGPTLKPPIKDEQQEKTKKNLAAIKKELDSTERTFNKNMHQLASLIPVLETRSNLIKSKSDRSNLLAFCQLAKKIESSSDKLLSAMTGLAEYPNEKYLKIYEDAMKAHAQNISEAVVKFEEMKLQNFPAESKAAINKEMKKNAEGYDLSALLITIAPRYDSLGKAMDKAITPENKAQYPVETELATALKDAIKQLDSPQVNKPIIEGGKVDPQPLSALPEGPEAVKKGIKIKELMADLCQQTEAEFDRKMPSEKESERQIKASSEKLQNAYKTYAKEISKFSQIPFLNDEQKRQKIQATKTMSEALSTHMDFLARTVNDPALSDKSKELLQERLKEYEVYRKELAENGFVIRYPRPAGPPPATAGSSIPKPPSAKSPMAVKPPPPPGPPPAKTVKAKNKKGRAVLPPPPGPHPAKKGKAVPPPVPTENPQVTKLKNEIKLKKTEFDEVNKNMVEDLKQLVTLQDNSPEYNWLHEKLSTLYEKLEIAHKNWEGEFQKFKRAFPKEPKESLRPGFVVSLDKMIEYRRNAKDSKEIPTTLEKSKVEKRPKAFLDARGFIAKPAETTPVVKPAAAAPESNETKAIKALIKEYDALKSHKDGIGAVYTKKLEEQGFFSVMLNAFRNAKRNPKRESQIAFLNSAFENANKLMSKEPVSAMDSAQALVNIRRAAEYVRDEIKKENNRFDSRLLAMAEDIIAQVETIQKESKFDSGLQRPKDKPK